MLENLITYFVTEILKFLENNQNFFDLHENQKKEKLSSLSLPKSIQNYLMQTDSDKFIKELNALVHFLKKEPLQKSHDCLIEAICEYFIKEFAEILDDQNEYLENKNINALLIDFLVNNSYQEITEAIDKFLRNIEPETKYIVIQAPRKLNKEVKKEIRKILLKKYKFAFPIFQVNSSLIGGIRIFIDGETIDNSWAGKINKINNLKIK
ncbi:hypothetical protein A2483_03085 [Candidatus Peregrinibacteria bacterium RIFOXYC2_FULL_33_13]|nr:MAG: hypothetical protein UR27_C0019G0029 [Candidatus Peregrinibacteria bacterium GW2011_GWA2_33_10]KKP39947.1 MAG: hypothetical protein UR30_C0007G0048 [Candidatus Peregrinibacteria bacterium GW2011_GWC2_33_13]OGJ50693.1 MAG: hypothetical protein A2229_04125 [Candidatus Peregrinibacteria bacterium RIFOXYA2_FULL_33_7]OGJ52018.1 MAG: hypothetical protein A2483_03085 [Candidatus Peregrinibacteria bacterium RIFOXYC2_FULL_33_13]